MQCPYESEMTECIWVYRMWGMPHSPPPCWHLGVRVCMRTPRAPNSTKRVVVGTCHAVSTKDARSLSLTFLFKEVASLARCPQVAQTQWRHNTPWDFSGRKQILSFRDPTDLLHFSTSIRQWTPPHTHTPLQWFEPFRNLSKMSFARCNVDDLPWNGRMPMQVKLPNKRTSHEHEMGSLFRGKNVQINRRWGSKKSTQSIEVAAIRECPSWRF